MTGSASLRTLSVGTLTRVHRQNRFRRPLSVPCTRDDKGRFALRPWHASVRAPSQASRGSGVHHSTQTLVKTTRPTRVVLSLSFWDVFFHMITSHALTVLTTRANLSCEHVVFSYRGYDLNHDGSSLCGNTVVKILTCVWQHAAVASSLRS